MAIEPKGRSYSVAEAADMLGVSQDRIRRLIEQGRLATRFSGDELRVTNLQLKPSPKAPKGNDSPAREPVRKAASETATQNGLYGPPQNDQMNTIVQVLKEQLDDRQKRIEELEREKFEMASQLGAFSERIRNLQEQLPALPEPIVENHRREGSSSWWRRLLLLD